MRKKLVCEVTKVLKLHGVTVVQRIEIRRDDGAPIGREQYESVNAAFNSSETPVAHSRMFYASDEPTVTSEPTEN